MEPPATGDCGGAAEGGASARPEPPSSLLIIEELEVLVHICGFLAQPKDLGRLACTSRAFGRMKISWKCAGMGEGEGAAQWSVVDEAARRWVTMVGPVQGMERGLLAGQSWLARMRYGPPWLIENLRDHPSPFLRFPGLFVAASTVPFHLVYGVEGDPEWYTSRDGCYASWKRWEDETGRWLDTNELGDYKHALHCAGCDLVFMCDEFLMSDVSLDSLVEECIPPDCEAHRMKLKEAVAQLQKSPPQLQSLDSLTWGEAVEPPGMVEPPGINSALADYALYEWWRLTRNPQSFWAQSYWKHWKHRYVPGSVESFYGWISRIQ